MFIRFAERYNIFSFEITVTNPYSQQYKSFKNETFRRADKTILVSFETLAKTI